MRCFVCAEGTLNQQESAVTTTVKGMSVEVHVSALVCSSCGHQALEGKDAAELMRLAADEYRRRHGLLTSADIQARRKSLGMNQKDFAAYLKVGEASVKRWESGQVQDEAMNHLIELKTSLSAARQNVTELVFKIAPSLA
jgi:putative zinc finger/helix-turn-helix YgiT family protein